VLFQTRLFRALLGREVVHRSRAASGNSLVFTAPVRRLVRRCGSSTMRKGPPNSGSYVLRVGDAPVALASGDCTKLGLIPEDVSSSAREQTTGRVVAVNRAGPTTRTSRSTPIPAAPALPSPPPRHGGDGLRRRRLQPQLLGTYYSRVSYGANLRRLRDRLGKRRRRGLRRHRREWHRRARRRRVRPDPGIGHIPETRASSTDSSSWQTAGRTFACPSSATRRTAPSGPGAVGEFEAGQCPMAEPIRSGEHWYGIVVFNNSPDSPAGTYTLRVRDLPASLAEGDCSRCPLFRSCRVHPVQRVLVGGGDHPRWSGRQGCLGLRQPGRSGISPRLLGAPWETDFVIGTSITTPRGRTTRWPPLVTRRPANGWNGDDGPDIFHGDGRGRPRLAGTAVPVISLGLDVFLEAGATTIMTLTDGRRR